MALDIQVDWATLHELDILIVDDSTALLQLLESLLMHVGFKHIHSANHGEEAIEIFKSQKIDITMLDIDMPIKNGIETLQEIIAFQSDAYIVMLTGHDTEDNVTQVKSMGAKAFISKPCSAEKIKRIFNEFALEKNYLQSQ